MLPPGSAMSGISLDVFNSSKQPGSAKLSRHFLIFQPNGAQMAINEGFIFTNAGVTTYNDPDGGTLKFFLPVAAKGIVQVKATAPQGMPIDRAAEKTGQPGIYKVDFPIKPGETNVQVSYLVPYNSGAVYEGRTVAKTEEPTLLVAPNGVTLQGEGVENKGQEPQSKATVYSVAAASYKVAIAGAMPVAAAEGDSSDNGGPALEEIAPKILSHNFTATLAGSALHIPSTVIILVLAFAILALGFIVLYRAQPATASPLTAKGNDERSRR
jgi:hypothetical protein